MRKIVVFNRISIDGFYASPNDNIDWFVNDPMVDAASHELMSPDTVLFGRLTYQQFEAVWPAMVDNPLAPEPAKVIARELSKMTKVVFSTTLNEATWANSKLISGDLAKEVGELKQSEGGDITIFGSGTIVQQLAREGLIDEYLLVLTPVVLGEGKPLFKGVAKEKWILKVARLFDSGNVLLHCTVPTSSRGLMSSS